jgi:hypothetical protein
VILSATGLEWGSGRLRELVTELAMVPVSVLAEACRRMWKGSERA